MIPVREDLAWAAGFFDGEGSVHVAYRSPTGLAYPQVSISQSGDIGHEVLHRFNKAIGNLGKVGGPRPPGKNSKQIRWTLEANGFAKVQAIMAMLWPWLGTVKRKQFAAKCDAYLTTRR